MSESNTDGQWSSLEIAGHTCRVFDPAQPSEHGYVVIYLHAAGLEDISDHPIITAEFARHGLRVVAPQLGPTWWCDRICPSFDTSITAERYIVDQVLPTIAQRWQTNPPAVGIMGVSMGGQGSLRLSYKYPNLFPVAAGIASAVDFHDCFDADHPQGHLIEQLSPLYRDKEDARQDTATLHIHPLNWPRNQFFCCDPTDHWHTSNERLRMKLYSMGIPHQCDLETSAGGHSWDYFHAMAPRTIEYVTKKLDEERRRV